MTYQLNIPDHKVPFFMELIKGFSYIEIQPLNTHNNNSKPLINNDLEEKENTTSDEDAQLKHIMKFVKSMRSFTVEDLVREQNYQGFDYEKFREIANRLDLSNEPIAELLECIK